MRAESPVKKSGHNPGTLDHWSRPAF